jgi:DNA-binding NarL/FixJ family response regulator
MPVMGGTAVARKIRVSEPRTKIVFLSMHDSEMANELARLAGVEASLSKRCSMDELHKVIADLFENGPVPRERKKEDVTERPGLDHFERNRQAFFTPGAPDQK